MHSRYTPKKGEIRVAFDSPIQHDLIFYNKLKEKDKYKIKCQRFGIMVWNSLKKDLPHIFDAITKQQRPIVIKFWHRHRGWECTKKLVERTSGTRRRRWRRRIHRVYLFFYRSTKMLSIKKKGSIRVNHWQKVLFTNSGNFRLIDEILLNLKQVTFYLPGKPKILLVEIMMTYGLLVQRGI